MNDVVVGIITIVVGAAFCFRGWQVVRVILPLVGAFAGFLVGGWIAADVRNEDFLDSGVGWAVAIGSALVVGLVAYYFYAVSVIVAMAAIGFSLASAALIALGVTWSWVIVGGAVLVAILVAVAAIAGNVPKLLLIVLSALAGAHAVVGGIMLLTEDADLADITANTVTELAQGRWWWYAAFGGLAVAGTVVQLGIGRAKPELGGASGT